MQLGPISYLEQLKNQNLHSVKISAIKEGHRTPQLNLFSNRQYHESAFRHRRIQEQVDIEAKNEVLLKRILSINKRKSQSVPNLHLPFVNHTRASRLSMIDSYNNFIARKLVKCKSYLPVNRMQQEYNVYLQRKRQLQHYKISPEGKVRHRSMIVAERLLARNPERASESIK